ncbi:MAG: hypothetical protein V3W41_22210 [Planctomycetota bacterium]
MARPQPEWTAKPAVSIEGKEMLTIHRGRKLVATLHFPARSGETLDELVTTLQRLWEETHAHL